MSKQIRTSPAQAEVIHSGINVVSGHSEISSAYQEHIRRELFLIITIDADTEKQRKFNAVIKDVQLLGLQPSLGLFRALVEWFDVNDMDTNNPASVEKSIRTDKTMARALFQLMNTVKSDELKRGQLPEIDFLKMKKEFMEYSITHRNNSIGIFDGNSCGEIGSIFTFKNPAGRLAGQYRKYAHVACFDFPIAADASVEVIQEAIYSFNAQKDFIPTYEEWLIYEYHRIGHYDYGRTMGYSALDLVAFMYRLSGDAIKESNRLMAQLASMIATPENLHEITAVWEAFKNLWTTLPKK